MGKYRAKEKTGGDFSRVTGGGLWTVSVIPMKEMREDTGKRKSKQFS